MITKENHEKLDNIWKTYDKIGKVLLKGKLCQSSILDSVSAVIIIISLKCGNKNQGEHAKLTMITKPINAKDYICN